MSRPVIGAVVAAFIAMLTVVAYVATTSRLEDRIEKDVRIRVAKAQELLSQNSSLEMLGLLKRTEALAREPNLLKALIGGSSPSARLAESAFQKFRAQLAPGEPRPDIMALTDENGRLIALVSGDQPVGNLIPDAYIQEGKIKYPGLLRAVEGGQITSEVWDYENLGPMKVGVAPIYDPAIDNTVGALILAYAMSTVEAKQQQKLLAADVAYFYGGRVSASSFGSKDRADGKAAALKRILFEGSEDGGKGLAASALSSETGLTDVVTVDLDGEAYWATAGRMPRFSTAPFPEGYPAAPAGAMVVMSLGEALSPLGSVKTAILMLGLGAIIVALLGMFITARRILHPLDEIETGVNDMINGNLDLTFRPVGSDLDGLANGLNVLLAKLLGRPEPGEEEYDDEGNVVRTQNIRVDTEGLSERDAEAVKLAAEPEAAYLKRVFDEYVAAREASGEGVQGVDYDSFTAKLKQNESVLKGKYQSQAVRFKVVTKDGKVTLKPVPIL